MFLEEKMKKLAIILAFMLIPCTAFGLQMLDDTTMDGITGQSGVSIAVDDIQMFLNIEKLAWIDCDGLTSAGVLMNSNQYGTCTGAAGAVGLNGFQIDVLNINGIVTSQQARGPSNEGQTEGTAAMALYSVDCGQIPLFYDYGQTGQAGCYLGSTATTALGTAGLDNYFDDNQPGFQARRVTIDATDRMPAISAGLNNNTGIDSISFGGIVIGLPTVEIYINSMSLTPYYTGDVSGSPSHAVNNNDDFGTIYMEGITFTVLSGWVEIGPH